MGSGKPADQIGSILSKLEPVIENIQPDAVLLYGDTNSTLAGCIVANHHNIPVIHVEAGERIYRRLNVPEERNRVAIDHLSNLCLVSTKKAQQYFKNQGVADERVTFVGDPMWDLFLWGKEKLKTEKTEILSNLKLTSNKYVLTTIHRAENTTKERLESIMAALRESVLPVVIPAHPRLRKCLADFEITPVENIKLIDSLGYFDFLNLLLNCERVVTDSGGVTRESFFAKKFSIVPMTNSWWK